jgi:glycerol-1-phosphatase
VLDVRAAEGILPKKFKDSAIALPGSRKLLSALEEAHAPWAIVTSGTLPLVTGWLEVMRLARPEHLVTAEDVKNGKPDPACYALGRERLGVEASKQPAARVLVLEDAPAGIRSGYAAGCEVVAVSSSHAAEELAVLPEAKWVVKDLASVTFISYDERTKEIEVEISGGLQRPSAA